MLRRVVRFGTAALVVMVMTTVATTTTWAADEATIDVTTVQVVKAQHGGGYVSIKEIAQKVPGANGLPAAIEQWCGERVLDGKLFVNEKVVPGPTRGTFVRHAHLVLRAPGVGGTTEVGTVTRFSVCHVNNSRYQARLNLGFAKSDAHPLLQHLTRMAYWRSGGLAPGTTVSKTFRNEGDVSTEVQLTFAQPPGVNQVSGITPPTNTLGAR